ncbi:M28 family peptidase [Chitinophaga vietnamensis]|uniref:M28 family peptidase n=1 Tax=Chitinophaga vietnamensis TaxID=2593957 RepID=UPI0013757E4D|nr:M28 family peptidase [Chitinophaga vietnamensis]
MRVFVTVCCSLLLLNASAQMAKQAPAAARPVATLYGEGITAAAARQQLHVIAGPGMEGRETATRGQQKAAAYIISQFEAAGLQPGANGQWEQHYPMYNDTLVHSSITVNHKTFQYGEEYLADLRAAHNEDFSAPVVYAGYGINYDSLDVKGKIVLVREGGENGRAINKPKLAADAGAKAILYTSAYARQYRKLDAEQIRKTGLYMDRQPTTAPNLYYITPALAAAILGVSSGDSLLVDIDKGLRVPVNVSAPIHITLEKSSITYSPSNVLGFLEGSDKKDEIVFVTAHYDHLGIHDGKIYYGADDDGSGTTAVIEIAKAFGRAKKAGHGPRRSMVFMTVSGEEKGLLGSRYYTEHPIYPLANTVVDLNIDMVGRIDPAHERDTNYVYIIGDSKLSSELRPINEKANHAYTKMQLDYKFSGPNDPEGFYYRSDHYMFAQHNIPIIFYFNGTHADYHKPTDTVEKINYELLARRARLVFYTAWDIANRDARLVVDRHEP